MRSLSGLFAVLLAWAGSAWSANGRDLGLPDQPTPAQPHATMRQLGAKLFFDKRLSADGTVSCASCHIPEQAFSDGKARAQGMRGALGLRNTPTLINVAQQTSMFWDGRRATLEEQAGDPFIHPSEHGLASHADLVRVLQSDPDYRAAFRQAFARPAAQYKRGARHNTQSGGITPAQVFSALATFQRTLTAGGSAVDRYLYGKQTTALSESARRGLSLFVGRARCSGCHVVGAASAPLTDGRFHALGIGLAGVSERLPELVRLVGMSSLSADRLMLAEPDVAALGRYLVTRDPVDLGAFKTPSLRNVALTAPYMHDGSLATLSAAVDREVYYRGTQDGRLLVLTPGERADLVAFMEALTSSGLDELARSARQAAGPAAARY